MSVNEPEERLPFLSRTYLEMASGPQSPETDYLRTEMARASGWRMEYDDVAAALDLVSSDGFEEGLRFISDHLHPTYGGPALWVEYSFSARLDNLKIPATVGTQEVTDLGYLVVMPDGYANTSRILVVVFIGTQSHSAYLPAFLSWSIGEMVDKAEALSNYNTAVAAFFRKVIFWKRFAEPSTTPSLDCCDVVFPAGLKADLAITSNIAAINSPQLLREVKDLSKKVLGENSFILACLQLLDGRARSRMADVH